MKERRNVKQYTFIKLTLSSLISTFPPFILSPLPAHKNYLKYTHVQTLASPSQHRPLSYISVVFLCSLPTPSLLPLSLPFPPPLHVLSIT